jgi:hypothetical protein
MSNTVSLKCGQYPSCCKCHCLCLIPHDSPVPLPRSTPDALEVAVLLSKSVHGVIGLAHSAHETAEGICLVLAGVAAVFVNLTDADLNGGVVLGLDDAASGAALAGDVDCNSCQ